MVFTFEVPEDAKTVKVSVLSDGNPCCCKEPRYMCGHWNGLHGGEYFGQYFDMDDVNRVEAMMEIASVLRDNGINYVLSKLKKQYRLMISHKDYKNMGDAVKNRINSINFNHVER